MNFSLAVILARLHRDARYDEARLPICFRSAGQHGTACLLSTPSFITSGCDGDPVNFTPARIHKRSSLPSTEATKSRSNADRARAGEKVALNKSPAGVPSYLRFLEREKGGMGDMR